MISDILSNWARDGFRGTGLFEDADLAGVRVLPTENPAFGDYQCNDAMRLAKKAGKPPRFVAESAVRMLAQESCVGRVEVAGPGFINITMNEQWLAARVSGIIPDSSLGVSREGAGKTVLIDYSSPNVAKRMHIGHIRSTIIGNALDRIYRFMGYRVIADNHLGDWGTQFGILINGYRQFADRDALAKSPVEELERIYVESSKRADDDEEWRSACKRELVKLQAGDPENLGLWNEFIAMSRAEFSSIYKRLDVQFDIERGESHYNSALGGVVERLMAMGLAVESEGAIVVPLDELNLPPCIIRKSDGGYLYATTDLAAVLERVDEFKPDRIIYVTDERQQLHFRQIFAVCRKMGMETELEHVWFGLMRLPGRTFSTREGNVIMLESLLDEAEKRAFDVVESLNPGMPDATKRDVAEAIGIGAVKYSDLSQNPQTTITFTWDKALSLDGNSAPYLQYTYARICSVLDKHKELFPDHAAGQGGEIVVTEPAERAVAVKLLLFPDAVSGAARNSRPCLLADYLYDLSRAYSSFYQSLPFLKAEETARESRISICRAVAGVLKQGLSLLGIKTPERI